jgi:acyl carrier protein
MSPPQQASPPELQDAVLEGFQRFLAIPQSPSLDSALSDLGVDSIGLVTVLLELAEQLHLDLETAEVELANIRTIEDVVVLVSQLQSTTLRVDQAANMG